MTSPTLKTLLLQIAARRDATIVTETPFATTLDVPSDASANQDFTAAARSAKVSALKFAL